MAELPNDLKCMTFSKNDISRIEKEAYQQGRVDREKELSELPNQYSERLWKNAYNKGRADEQLNSIEELKQVQHDCILAIEKAREDAIEVCARVVSSLVGICKTSCPIDCNWGTDESCVESWKIYLTEQMSNCDKQ